MGIIVAIDDIWKLSICFCLFVWWIVIYIITFVASFIDMVPSCLWVYPFMKIAFFSHWESFWICFSVQNISCSWLYWVVVQRTVHAPYFVPLALVLWSGVSIRTTFCCGAIICDFKWKIENFSYIYKHTLIYIKLDF